MQHERRVCQRRQLHEPNAIAVLREGLSRQLQRQPGFPGAAGADEREQVSVREQVVGLGQLALSPDKTRELYGQVIGEHAQCFERRELRGQVAGDHLPQVVGGHAILEVIRAHIEQRNPFGQLAAHQLGAGA